MDTRDKTRLRSVLTNIVRKQLDLLQINYGKELTDNNIKFVGTQSRKTNEKVCVYDIYTDDIIVRLYLSPAIDEPSQVGEIRLGEKVDNKYTYELWISLDYGLFVKGNKGVDRAIRGYYNWKCADLDYYLFEMGVIETENVVNAILTESGGFIYLEDAPGIVDTSQELDSWNKQDNLANAQRTLTDKWAPELVIVPGKEIYAINEPYVEMGAKLMDNQTELTAVTLTINGEVNTLILGTYTVTYQATDQAGNSYYASRHVDVVNPTPIMVLNGQESITINQDEFYMDEGVTATTYLGEPLMVKTTSPVDTSTPGEYTVTYTTQDSDGNSATITRSVTVV